MIEFKDIAVNIKRIAKEKHIKYADIANSMEISEQAIKGMLSEKGSEKVKPTLTTLNGFASALGVSVVELFDTPTPATPTITCPKCGTSIPLSINIDSK